MKCLALTAPAILALAACGSNSVNLGGSDTEFDELIQESVALTARIDDPNLLGTETLPGSTVSYNGVAVIADDFGISDEGVIGDVAMMVDFSSAELSGSVDSFYSTPIDGQDPQDQGTGLAVPGMLDLSSTVVDLAFFMEVNGDVTLEGTDQTVDASIASVFLGESAEVFLADSTFDGSTSTHDIVITATSD